MRIRRIAALLLVAFPLLAQGQAPGVYALSGGTVHPVTGPPVPGGVVIIRGGLIEAAGANVAVPPDAMVIDVSGAHIYPGLIDAQTSLGFTRPRTEGRQRAPEPGPESLAARTVTISAEDARARRKTGVTTIVTAPVYGIFNGQSAALNLGEGDRESQVLRTPAALQISFTPRPTWTYPDSLMGVVAYLRQTFLDAQQHAAAREIYERAPAGLRRPADDPSLAALHPAIRGEVPVVFLADSESMIRRARTIAREFGLRPVISGAREAYAIAEELKGVPVLVSVKWPAAPSDRQDREDQPLRVIRQRQLAPTTPAALAKAGVPFALVSGPARANEFMPGIRKAIEHGLTPEEALRATTLQPARIFGLERQLGSLERGKIANLVVTDRPIFDAEAKVTRVFIDGREIRLPAEEPRATDAAAPANAIDGSWALTVRASQGSVALQLTLRTEGGNLTGTYAGDRGSGDIRGGRVDGATFEFTISALAETDAEMSDWVFRGTVDGDSMSGTVATTLGAFEFSGSRAQ